MLRLLEIKEYIVTVDALNCQKGADGEIRRLEADYLFALKGNRGLLKEVAERFFNAVREDHTYGVTI